MPTKSDGLSSSVSTSPGIGRYMVCRVDVRMTADFVLRVELTSSVAPSSSSSSSSPENEKSDGNDGKVIKNCETNLILILISNLD